MVTNLIHIRNPRNERGPSSELNALDLENDLRRGIQGEVRFDRGSRALYATDASNYRQAPIGVVIPKSLEDVFHAVAVCRLHGAPLLSRGGGTSLAGQCCNVAVVLDWSKYLNHILEINAEKKFARVQPGTICDEVVNAARPYELTYAPDPATHNHCCFGGMLGNNSCGAHAQIHGPAVNNVEEMDLLLYDGTRMGVGWMTEMDWENRIRAGGREGEIYASLKSLRQRYQALIEQRYPKIIRRVSGYNLDQLIPDSQGRINIARALIGSEGTCVTILEACVTLVYNHPERVLLVLGYPDIYSAADHLMQILEFQPIALEGLDERLHQNIEKKGGHHRKYLSLLPPGKGWLLVEFGYDTQQEAIDQAQRLMEILRKDSHPPHMELLIKKDEQQKIWDVRESGLGATAFVPGERDAWPGWEDSAVAPEKVGGYLRDLRALFNKYEYNPALYGHFGQGCIHCRVNFDLFTGAGVRKYRSFMEEATDLIVRYGGSFSGEHGDGQSRAEFLPKMFGSELIQAFREFKSIWDPDWKMNPGKIVDPYRMDENLRLGASYAPWEPATHFKFPDDHGSFAHAALRCVGVGKCRRQEGRGEQDTMCPSFMVTREEKDTTRGRTHALWEMLHGDVITGGWHDDHVKEALDLCLSCKGCKGDCPVNVDMATYKAEFLSHYWEGKIRPIHAYAFGWIDKWAKLASIAPGLTNLFTQLPMLSTFAKAAVGMPRQRRVPAFAPQTFQSWFATNRKANAGSAPDVILWADTFNNYFFPETAIAALEVLEAAGHQVSVPQRHLCCGRPLYDYGFLDMAEIYLRKIMQSLKPAIDTGTPMVVLEPSCCSVFRDELHNLFPEEPLARKLAEQTFTFSEFLEKTGFQPPPIRGKALVHGHCHHKAIMRLDHEESLLRKTGLDFELLSSGCCGMAGSFGFERDKYEVSVKAGERVLLPKVRKAEAMTLLVADGFSCREQIAQGTERHALHTAEVLQLALRNHGAGKPYPERAFTEPRKKKQKQSMVRAGILAAGALLSGIAWIMVHRRSA